MKSEILKPVKLIVSLLVCLMAGVIGSIFTSISVDNWYKTLNKPVFNPPSWLFAPVWTFLYITMGFSLFLIWSYDDKQNKRKYIALIFFSVQLFFNILWSVFFFGMKSPFLAFVDIILLWGSILITMILFKRISVLSSILLIPYFLWVTFAAFLNYAILVMN
ncbi:MAG TPA: tryptophan-rich sensory protein [bacterium]|nr:tryptophan-rich sensory protein [bacterium]